MPDTKGQHLCVYVRSTDIPPIAEESARQTTSSTYSVLARMILGVWLYLVGGITARPTPRSNPFLAHHDGGGGRVLRSFRAAAASCPFGTGLVPGCRFLVDALRVLWNKVV